MDDLQNILNDMKKLGFSEYECKAYLALLETYPQNGYSLSKRSGIPRSRIYEVLKQLVGKQVVFEQAGEKSSQYYPVPPDTLLEQLKSDYRNLFSNLSRHTRRIYRAQEKEERLVVIQGRRNIIDFLKKRIDSAQKRIAVSIWEEEICELYPELDRALERGVLLRGIYFGTCCRYTELVPHRRIQRYMAEKKERYISITMDGIHTLSGIVSRGENSRVTWTQDEGFIEISEDYIAHDLLVNLYSASLSPADYQAFEDFADNVHNHYFRYSHEALAQYKKMK